MINIPFVKKKKGKEVSKKDKKDIKREKEPKKARKEGKSSLKKNGPKIKFGESTVAFRVLREPIISEKGTTLEKDGKYIFKVFSMANKNEIKKAIQEVYKIKVEKINIITVKPKKRRIGRIEGWKTGYKKAIVTLEKGKKIEVVSR